MREHSRQPSRRRRAGAMVRRAVLAALLTVPWLDPAAADDAGAAPTRALSAPSPPVVRSEAWVRRSYAPVLRLVPEILGPAPGEGGRAGGAKAAPEPDRRGAAGAPEESGSP